LHRRYVLLRFFMYLLLRGENPPQSYHAQSYPHLKLLIIKS
jgi:hypothetical protein